MGPARDASRDLVMKIRHGLLVAMAVLLLTAGGQLARAQAWATAEVVTSDSGASRRTATGGGRAWARESSAESEDSAPRASSVARDHSEGRTNFVPRDQSRARDSAAARPESRSAGVSATNLFALYSQGDKDNCGAVALTKLVFALYGEAPGAGPFSHVDQNDGSVAVVLADRSVVYVTAQQARLAARESGMEAGEGTADAANLIYAAMAVRLANTRDGRRLAPAMFARALKTLGAGGEAADEDALAPLLGFAFDDASADNGAKDIYLLSSPLHVAFASGSRYDEHGEAGGETTRNFLKTYRDADNDLMFGIFWKATAEATGSRCW